MTVKINAGTVAGKFRMVAIKPDGTERILADWFDNLITNAGLDRLATGSTVMSQAVVGSGNTAPANSDTSLAVAVAVTGTVTTTANGSSSSAPYFGWYRNTYRFSAGVATGTLREIGVGWNYGSGGLFSRALIKDSNGDPTSVVVLADEVVDVTYELRLYAPSSDATFDVDISGTTYSCVLRASYVTSSYWVPMRAGGAMADTYVRAYSGDIGTITQQPSGTQNAIDVTWDQYVPGSYELNAVFTAQLTHANFAGGIKSVAFQSSWLGTYQCSFTPAIPKDANKVLTLDATISWARHAG